MADSLWQALDYLRQGGWIMIPLGICSIVMWLLIFERLTTYRALGNRDISIQKVIASLKGKPIELYSQGLRVQVLRDFQRLRTGDPGLDAKMVQQCALEQRGQLRHNLSFIAVLAAVAPLLGLLGTVLGMIETFNVIAIFGTGNAKAMAGGISVALVTTQSGLLVAIPGLFLSGLLSRQARQLENRLDEITTILARIVKRGDATEATAA